MLKRTDWEKIEKDILARYAVHSEESRGRKYPEKEHPYRTSFKRDLDRVIHSTAFRRLEYKTQVFIYHEGDYYRNRLTHTIEVQQIARTIARILRLNEDLAEAISLAHDIGHTPFGHKGEYALNILMKKFGGFEHNRHGLRVVDKLEKRYRAFEGLNLTYEVREGIVKHKTTYDKPRMDEFSEHRSSGLEAQTVNFADEIAYTSHDVDDGLKSNILGSEELEESAIWREVMKKVKKYGDMESEMEKITGVRFLINFLVEDLVTESEKNLAARKPSTVEEVRNMAALLSFSGPVKKEYENLKKILLEKMYNHYRVIRMAEKASMVLEKLFKTYCREPKLLPPHIYANIKKEPVEQIVCDYVAGMTDRFAQEEYKRLFDPQSLV